MTDTTSAAPSLLPCPFCGKTHSLIMGAASEMWDADEHGQYPHTETYAVFCDASTDGRKGGCGGAGGYRLTKDDAIEAWNRRAHAVTPSDAEIEAQWRESVAKHETTAAFVRDFARAVMARWGAPQPVARKPMEADVSAVNGINARIHFRRGWRAAEAAHGIGAEKGNNHGLPT